MKRYNFKTERNALEQIAPENNLCKHFEIKSKLYFFSVYIIYLILYGLRLKKFKILLCEPYRGVYGC